MPSFDELENPLIEATQVISEDGVSLGTFFSPQENREIVSYEQISPYMINAIISIEDQRYYKHSGIDFLGLIRVVIKSVILRQDTGGGSTITQQLAKNLFPREDSLSTVGFAVRKFREWVIAVKLEKTFTKEEILALYLNKLSFVNNAEGIQTASAVYFNKEASQLEIHEAAMLAGMAKNPSPYNPLRFGLKNTLPRRNTVLDKMKARGYADAATIGRAKAMDLGLDYHRVDHKVGRATYFREYLRGVLTESRPKSSTGAAAWDNNPLRGFVYKHLKPDGSTYSLYRDGLRIYTTIDSRMQQYAEEAVVEHLKKDLQPTFDRELRRLKHTPFSNTATDENIATSMNSAMGWSERYRVLKKQNLSAEAIKKQFSIPVPMSIFSWKGEIDTVMTPMDSIKYYKRYLRSAFMAITPQTGFVKAYVGGADYRYFQYDQIMQGKRQVGSVFKPFVYTVALENGLSPCYEVPNVPVVFTGNFNSIEGNTYEPEFSDAKEVNGQMVTLRTGLSKSLNQISAWIMKQYNPEAVIEVARKVGIKSAIEPVLPICVGAVDLPVHEVAGAFTAFANKGIWVEPIMVTRIEDKNGNVLASFSTHEEVAMSEETAYKMLYMMEGVTSTEGTARRLRNKPEYQFKNPIAGKTGTTNNYADGWFIGIVPDLIGAAWTGAEDKMVHFTNHDNGQGANMALPIWALFMKKVYADPSLSVSQEAFERPLYMSDPLNCDGMKGETIKPGKRKKSDFDEF